MVSWHWAHGKVSIYGNIDIMVDSVQSPSMLAMGAYLRLDKNQLSTGQKLVTYCFMNRTITNTISKNNEVT
jgi:hypothetical protein